MADPIRNLLDNARAQTTRGDFAGAISSYEQALLLGVRGDDRCTALTQLVSALVQVRRLDDATKRLAQVTSEFPDQSAVRVLFVDLARTMELQEFVHQFDYPFLLSIQAVSTAAAADYDDETVFGESAPPPPSVHTPLPIARVSEALAVKAHWGIDETEEWARGFDPSEITVGRSPSNDVVILDPRVSKLHAVFRKTADGWELSDVGSRNGTFVRNRRIVATDAPAGLMSGDLIVFGQTALFFLSPADLWSRVRRT